MYLSRLTARDTLRMIWKIWIVWWSKEQRFTLNSRHHTKYVCFGMLGQVRRWKTQDFSSILTTCLLFVSRGTQYPQCKCAVYQTPVFLLPCQNQVRWFYTQVSHLHLTTKNVISISKLESKELWMCRLDENCFIGQASFDGNRVSTGGATTIRVTLALQKCVFHRL